MSDRILTDAERDLLIALNGEPNLNMLGDGDLLAFLTEDLIRSTLGNNEHTEYLLNIRKENELEF